MTKKLGVVLFVLVIAGMVASAAPQGTGKIEGIARDQNQQPLAGVTVQCRNTATGQIVGTQQTSSAGAFSFTGLLPGTYVVELVDRDGKIIGVSSALTLSAPNTMTLLGVIVTATAQGSVGPVVVGGFGAWLTSTTGLLVLGGLGAATIVGVIIATKGDASPSK